MNITNYPVSDWLYRKLLLSPLGLDRENSIIFWLLILFAAMLGGGLYLFDGNVPLVVGIIYITFTLFLSIFRIDYSLYLFIFTVLLFDQYPIPGFTSITHDVRFFSNLKEITYVPFFDAGMISPFEIHLFFITLALFLHASIKKNFFYKPVTVWAAFLIFFVCLAAAFANGLRGGGDLLIAIWEIRALFYLCLMYVIVSQIVDTKKQIYNLFWVIIVAITIKAFQGVERFIDMGFTTGGYAVLTNHEDPVFMVVLFVLFLGLILFKTGRKQRNWILLFSLVFLLGFYVAQRRATYASLMVSVTAFIIILPFIKQIQFMKYFLPALILLMVYGAAFWNVSGSLGRPVQMVKSGFVEPELESNFQDYSSNLYRDNENYNLAHTIVNNPAFGTGFGKRYDQPIPLVEIRYSLRDYIPHNQIFWIFVKMGAIGFFAFWYFFNCYVAKGTQIFHRLKDPYLKVITLVVVISVINQLVVSYFDLQLTYYRNMIFLGSLMGLLPVINELEMTDQTIEAELVGDSDE